MILAGCEKKENLKIGFVGDLTGSMSDLGINGRNGVLIAVEERNAAGGIDGQIIELITKDDKHEVEQALKVDQELFREGVVAILKQARLEGLQGEITFDKYGDAHRKTSIVAIQNQQSVVIE
ncbi:MAG: ABC-type branched-subunit amino acid transport system substrate-binding protein [Desulforhopalus sp.]|jgi:ABC-type branched-subunit amino acid transport system substrate-binding protein